MKTYRKTAQKLAKLLTELLTKEEFLELAEFLDNDESDLFYAEVIKLAAKMAPELFSNGEEVK